MSSSSAALGARLAVSRAAARAAIGDLRPANAGATKTHQIGDLVIDPATGQIGSVIHVTTQQIHPPDPEAPGR